MLNIEEIVRKGELFDSHYLLIRPLSVDGATADVWLALDTNTVTDAARLSEIPNMHDEEIEKMGLVVAIKIYRPQSALDIEGEQRFREEYMIVFNCHHTNLIQPTHFSIFKEIPYLVLPYCKRGSSELLIGTKMENDNIWKYILDVSSGLSYLHSLTPPIIHQDIKPANILLDDTSHYAITDFGISAQRGGVHGYYFDDENSGTLAYMAPERFQDDAEPMSQSDIWALGATLYEILTGKVPFGEEGGKLQAQTDLPMHNIPNVSSDIQRLIYACLAKEPGNRPTADQLVEAARAKQYPIKSRKKIFVLICMLCVMFMGGLFYSFSKQPLPESENNMANIKELYDSALKNLDCENIDSLKKGLSLMDSLSNVDYVPAIYEMAFTYGWFSDVRSLNRKKMLGIVIGTNNLPVSDNYNTKAVALFERIIELNDSLYPSTNARAAFTLACYYSIENNVYKKNLEKGKSLMHRAKEWAIIAGDDKLLKKINDFSEGLEHDIKIIIKN